MIRSTSYFTTIHFIQTHTLSSSDIFLILHIFLRTLYFMIKHTIRNINAFCGCWILSCLSKMLTRNQSIPFFRSINTKTSQIPFQIYECVNQSNTFLIFEYGNQSNTLFQIYEYLISLKPLFFVDLWIRKPVNISPFF